MPSLIDQTLWVNPTITVLDGDGTATFHLQDCFNFHGSDAVGGVVLGFRLLQAVQSHLNHNQPMQRREVTLWTAFPGLGARDVFELVTRMCSDNRFELNVDFEHPSATKGVFGSFYYRFGYGGSEVELAPLAGAPSADFIAIGRASKDPNASQETLAQWTALKHDLANALLKSPADAVIRRL